MFDSLRPHGLYRPWNSPGQNTGVGSLSLLKEDLPKPGIKPGLPHCRPILYQLKHKGSPNFVQRRKKKKKKSDTCSCLLLPLKREGQNVWHGQPISSVWRPLAFLPVTLSRTKGGAPVSHIAGGFFTVGATREAWNRLPCIAGPWVRGLNCKPPLHPSPYPSSPLATRSLLSV